jgi:hypothetical protein
MPPLSKPEREQRQREVDAWVRWRLSQKLDLCSAETRPSCGSAFELMERYGLHSAQGLGAGCEEASRLRREAVATRSLSPIQPLDGRWAVFEPDCADFCALAQVEGFIDSADAPGWDVWVECLELDVCDQVLLMWIPRPLVDKIDEGTKLSVLGALSWADGIEVRRAGITGCLVSLGIMTWPEED